MKKRRLGIYCVISALVILFIIIRNLFGWQLGAMLHGEEMVYDIGELTGMIARQIDSGADSGTYYVSDDITEDDIMNINDYLCSINGVVDKYSVLQSSREGRRIKFFYAISDNYYVYEKYVNGIGIPDGRDSADELYAEVADIIDSIISDEMSDYDKELAIHDYIVKNCVYGYADDRDLSYRAYGALILKKAVCNGYAEAMALLLGCVGIDNEIMTGYADDELHAWNRVLIEDEWYQVDVTWDDPVPDRGTYAGHRYFNVTDDIMDDAHIWDFEEYPACDSMTYNYFEQNGLICTYEEFKQTVIDYASRDITATIEVVLTDYTEEGYSYDFMQDIQGLMYYQRSKDVEEYGPYRFITLYLNQRD